MTTIKNKVQLIGNLGKDPEVRHLEGGKVVANFNIATSDTFVNQQGEKIQNTQWHSVVAWGNTAKIAEKYLKKGSEVAIQGKLTHRSYEDKNGQTKYISEVLINEIMLMGSKKN
jgi:single-strand DNA-binding protein